jgi:hypothetical protein
MARIEKKLSYRLPLADTNADAAAASMAAHWRGFTWETGPVIVRWVSTTHGEIQVWAATENEGRGVVEHAMAHIGANDDEGKWIVSTSRNPRFGRVTTVKASAVSARSGSDGIESSLLLEGRINREGTGFSA